MTALSRRSLLMATLLASTPLASAVPLAAQAQAPAELNVGIISVEGSQALKARWEPFLTDMEKAVGIKVNGFYPSDYGAVVEAMRFNKIQLAWYGNASAIQAVDRADGEVFVQKSYVNGALGYYSILVVNTDSPIKSFADLLHAQPGTLNLGWGDPNSTSGFLIPGYYAWAKNNIDIRKFFKNVVSANHGANLLAVANKTVDVATNNTEDLENFQKAQPARAAMVREIWRSPLIPSDPMAWRKDLDPGVKARLLAFFLGYGTDRPDADVAHERQVLKDLGDWGPFHKSSNDQLLPVRQVAVFRDRLNTENSTTLSAEEKAKKIADLDARLKELDAQMDRLKTPS